MPQPTVSQVHSDMILTNISVAYIQRADHFVSWQVFPTVSVEKQRDIYYTYDQDDWFRDEAEPRADGTESAGTGYGLSTDNYSCDVYAIHKDIGPQAMQNADEPLNLERDASQLVTQKMMLRQEIQFVADHFTGGVWDTDITPGNLWDDYATSDPIDDVEEGKETILADTGYEPNTLVFGYQVWRQLKWHPDIRDVIKYTTSEITTAELLARLFEVDRVIVAKAIKATAVEGNATQTYAFTHGKHALLCYVNPTPSLMAPSAGYTFTWNGVSDGIGANVGISREEIPLTRGAIRVEGQMAWDNKVVSTQLGYFFESVVS